MSGLDRTPTLSWSHLTSLYGDEATLKQRIGSLNTQFGDLKPWIECRGILLDDSLSLLELANKYLSGWRPEQPF